MGKQRVDASLVLRWRKLVLGLVVLLVNGVHLAHAHGSELRSVTRNPVAKRKVVADIDHGGEDNYDDERSM